MIQMQMESKRVIAVIEGSHTIPYLAQSIQIGIEFFLAHGLSTFMVSREKASNGNCAIEMIGYGEPKPLAFSSCSILSQMAQQGYFPYVLEKNWESESRHFFNQEGQDRIAAKPLYQGETILSQHELNKTITIAELSYGLSDTFVEFFVRGCTKVKHQSSMMMAQSVYNFGMSKQELDQFFNEIIKNIPYDVNKPVRDLPLHFDPRNN